jgi:hypothetical protein
MIARHEPLVHQKNIKRKKGQAGRSLGQMGQQLRLNPAQRKRLQSSGTVQRKRQEGCKRPVRKGCTDREAQQWEGGGLGEGEWLLIERSKGH